MADQIPIKVLLDGSSNTCGLAQFIAGDTVGTVDGGTGLATQGICGFTQPGINAVACKSTYIGICAGKSEGEADENTYVGYGAGQSVTTGCYHTIIGSNAGDAITTCSGSVLIGYNAGTAITFGDRNTAIGTSAGAAITTATDNALVGYISGCVTTGNNNTGLGACTLALNTVGVDNVVIGSLAGKTQVAAGCNNTYIGSQAGEVALCRDNTLVGAYAGTAQTSATCNTMLGGCVGYGVVAGAGNVYIGYKSGLVNTSGNDNVFIGKSSGAGSTASCCLIIGNGTCDIITGTFNTPSLTLDADTFITNGKGMVIGHTAQVTGQGVAEAQVLGTTSNVDASLIIGGWSTDGSGYPTLQMIRGNHGTIGTSGSALGDNQSVAALTFLGDDGGDFATGVAAISIEMDGAGSANDMPGRMVFKTNAGGAGTTEALRIDSAQKIYNRVDNTGYYTGAGNDSRFYFDGSHTKISHIPGSGNLYLQVNSTENALLAETNGTVKLYYDNVEKFATTATGVEIPYSSGLATAEISTWSTNAAHYSALTMQKSASATQNTLAATADDERLGIINFNGIATYDSGTVATAATIRVDQDGSAAAGAVPGRIMFSTSSSSAVVERMRIDAAGNVYIGDTANGNMTNGLTINQGTADNQIFALKSSCTSHGMTSFMETDTYLGLKKMNTAGGTSFTSIEGKLGCATGCGAFEFNSYHYASVNTCHDPISAARGSYVINSGTRTGTSATSLNAEANILTVANWCNTVALIDAEGDIYNTGVSLPMCQTAFWVNSDCTVVYNVTGGNNLYNVVYNGTSAGYYSWTQGMNCLVSDICFVAAVAGTYVFNAHMKFTGVTSENTYYYAGVMVTDVESGSLSYGSAWEESTKDSSVGPGIWSFQTTAYAQMDVGDTAHVYINVLGASTNNLDLAGGNNHGTVFGGHLVSGKNPESIP